MALKETRTHTDVGPLPPDWQVLPLGALIRTAEYGSSAPSRLTGKVPVLRMGNLQGGQIDWSDLVYTDDAAEIGRYELRAEDVLFNRTNTVDLVGKTSLYDGERKAIFAGYLIRVVTVAEKLDPRYLNYVMNTEIARRHSAKVLSVAVGQANINGQKLRTYPIPLPPTLAEQRAIATALSDVDALLNSLGRLIAKKRDLKQVAMQQLLSGRTRLPGFTGEWQVGQLGDVFGALEAGVSVNSTDDDGSAAHDESGILKTSAVAGGLFIPRECKKIAVRDLHRARLNPVRDTILISRMNTPGLVGECGYVDRDYPNLFVPDRLWMARLRKESGASALWLSYLLSTPALKRQLGAAATGTSGSMKNLSKSAFLGIRTALPSAREQVVIAAALHDIDVELALLERRREKTNALKQAMMQELLTGRTRLVPLKACHA